MNYRDLDVATRADLLLDGEIWNRMGDRWELHRGKYVRLFDSYTELVRYLDSVEDRLCALAAIHRARRNSRDAVRKVKP